jgi:hypothetical protein
MSCVLRAAGDSFEVAAFLAESPFRPHAVYGKGEPLPGELVADRVRSASGFDLTVSEAGLSDLDSQILDAIVFLDQHEDELRRLGGFPGLEAISLAFAVARREVVAQTESFPSDLLWRAGALDIALAITHYAVADGRQAS